MCINMEKASRVAEEASRVLAARQRDENMQSENLQVETEKPTTGVSGAASLRQVGGDHYRSMAIQPVDYILANRMDFLSGSVVKYVSRHGAKGGAEDIRKAIHFCELILEKVYGVDRDPPVDPPVSR